jgi:integrase
MTRVGRDGVTRYVARWYTLGRHGKPVLKGKTFHSLDDAEDHLRAIGRAKRTGRYAPPAELTVAELIADYLDRARHRVTDRTLLTYRTRADTTILPQLGTKRITALQPIDLQRWIDDLVRQGYAPATIHTAVAVLSGALREATMLGLIPRNPAIGIRRPTIPRRPMAIWTEPEARRVLTAVRDDPVYGTLYAVALATGMRPGELRALRWRDVDLDARRLTVRATMSKDEEGFEYLAERTKSGQARAIALAPATVDRLRWHRARQNERRLGAMHWHEMDIVFDRGDGHWLNDSTWHDVHRRLCTQLDVAPIRLHDLRHSSASLELAAGTHPRIVADRLGHARITITLDRYSHVDSALQERAAEALSARLFEDVGDTTTSSQ